MQFLWKCEASMVFFYTGFLLNHAKFLICEVRQ